MAQAALSKRLYDQYFSASAHEMCEIDSQWTSNRKAKLFSLFPAVPLLHYWWQSGSIQTSTLEFFYTSVLKMGLCPSVFSPGKGELQ